MVSPPVFLFFFCAQRGERKLRFNQIQLGLLGDDFVDVGCEERELVADFRAQRTLDRGL